MTTPAPPAKGHATKRFPSLSHWGAFTAVVENDRLVRCEPFALDPAPSPILEAMPGMVHSPLRIARPAVRAGWLRRRQSGDRAARGHEPFVEVAWDEALDLVAEELARVRSGYGHGAIFGGSYGWSSAGRLHHARSLTHRFLHSGGGCTNQVGNYSWGAAQFILPHVIGTYAPVTGRETDWRSILDHTELFIAFGGLPMRNTQVTSGGAGAHSTHAWVEKAIRSRIEFVVISPTRAIPAGMHARWLTIRPGTDTALMLGMAHTLLREGLHDAEFLTKYCVGFERFAAYVLGNDDGQPKDAAWASAICGIDAGVIANLARRAARRRTLVNCTWAIQRAQYGEQPYWASIALAAMLGQIGLPGGGFAFAHGSINGAASPRTDVPAPEMPRLPNPIARTVPASRWIDMLLHPGATYAFNGHEETYPDIRLIYWAGGNPFHHGQDLNQLVRAWRKPETVIVHDSWWTPVARRADIVLPATTSLERNDIGGSSTDQFAMAMHQALPPQASSRNDFDIFRELAARAGHEAAFTAGRDESAWLHAIYARMATKWQAAGADMGDFDAFWSRGYAELPQPARHAVLFEDFRRAPDDSPLDTPSGRIELYSDTIAGFGYADCPPHPAWLAPVEWLGAPLAKRWPLHLLTPQPSGKLHSQLDPGCTSSARDKRNGRQCVRLNPDDAQRRGIGDGDLVRVFNQRGACLGTAVIDADVMPGVLVMATGAWFDPCDEDLECHGNPNVLTLDIGTSRLAQACCAQTALVDVERRDGPAPPVHAFEPPRLEHATETD